MLSAHSKLNIRHKFIKWTSETDWLAVNQKVCSYHTSVYVSGQNGLLPTTCVNCFIVYLRLISSLLVCCVPLRCQWLKWQFAPEKLFRVEQQKWVSIMDLCKLTCFPLNNVMWQRKKQSNTHVGSSALSLPWMHSAFWILTGSYLFNFCFGDILVFWVSLQESRCATKLLSLPDH